MFLTKITKGLKGPTSRFPCLASCCGATRVEMTGCFLWALHCFSVNSIIWRSLPQRYGHWNSVWKRFSRLSKSGVFEVFFEHLASLSTSADLVQMFDSTVVRAHVVGTHGLAIVASCLPPFIPRTAV